MIKASIIAAFYKSIDYLKLVLAGFERQTEKNFELIVADDGSSEEIGDEIKKLTSHYTYPIKHIWHEDKGFRKNKILNKAIENSESDYLIFIDADCIPHKAFVEGHLNYANSNTSLTGRRVNLSQKITNRLTEENVLNGFLEKNVFRLVKDGLFGKSIDVEKGFYLRNKLLLKYLNRKKRGILGCNFSLFKEDIFKVNGFDERYVNPSIGEDSDLQFRLELLEIKIKSINHAAVQYHLYHQLQERLKKNLRMFDQVKQQKIAFTPFGIKK
jgi:glycosyltransferase involved in cell wall biosynthesis